MTRVSLEKDGLANQLRSGDLTVTKTVRRQYSCAKSSKKVYFSAARDVSRSGDIVFFHG